MVKKHLKLNCFLSGGFYDVDIFTFVSQERRGRGCAFLCVYLCMSVYVHMLYVCADANLYMCTDTHTKPQKTNIRSG